MSKKLPEQTDSVSCGVYTLWYMQLYVDNRHGRGDDCNPDVFRQELLSRILYESDSLINDCLHCGQKSHGQQMVMCFNCMRYVDFKCLPAAIQRTFNFWKEESNEFLCFLCQV